MDEVASTQPERNGSLADQELVNSLSWIIALRWPAGVGLLAGTWFVVNIVDADIPATWLYLL
ncbi:MAG: hypothetical protein PVF47_12535, partial [Anaerolineae bacterium]